MAKRRPPRHPYRTNNNPIEETTIAKHSMDLLELIRKRGVDGDVNFLREALQTLPDVNG